jgi:hypothetical protein
LEVSEGSEVGEVGEGKENELRRVVFRVAIREKDAQEAVDLIEFLCFMLSL